MNVYTFNSEPKSVKKSNLYRDANPEKMGSNIMFDPRVVRGSAFITHHIEIVKEEPPVVIKSRAHKNGSSIFDLKAPTKGYEMVDLTPFLVDQTPPVEVFTVSTQTDDISEAISPLKDQKQSLGTVIQHNSNQRPTYIPFKTGVDSSTQIENYELFNFNNEIGSLLNVLTSKIIEQAQTEVCEEEELHVISERKSELYRLSEEEKAKIKQIEEYHKQKLIEKDKLKKIQQQKLEIKRVLMDKVAARRLSEEHAKTIRVDAFDILQKAGFFVDINRVAIKEDYMPWLYQQVNTKLHQSLIARQIVDLVIHEAIKKQRVIHEKRKAEYEEMQRLLKIRLERERNERELMSIEDESSKQYRKYLIQLKIQEEEAQENQEIENPNEDEDEDDEDDE